MLSRQYSPVNTLLVSFLLVLLSVSCTGESTQNPVTTQEIPAGGVISGQDQSANFVLLPSSQIQSNTISQALVTDSGGKTHATYADIDGRVFYAVCQVQCQQANSWSGVELISFTIDSLLGAVTPKILLDDNQNLHIGLSYNRGNFGILSEHQLHYLSCESACLDSANWTSGLVVTLESAATSASMAKADWFALNQSGLPRFSYIQSAPGSTDEFLFYFSCENACHNEANWLSTKVAELNLASNQPADIVVDRTDVIHIVASYRTVGSNKSSLLYFTCVSQCNSESQWSEPTELLQITDSSFFRDDISIALREGISPVIAVFDSIERVSGDQPAVYLLACETGCSGTGNWSRSEVLSAVSLADTQSVELSESGIALRVDGGLLQLGMIGRDLQSDVQNQVFSLSCNEPCVGDSWFYQSLADTRSFNLNVADCLYLGAEATGPISLLPIGVGFGIIPQLGCKPQDNRYFEYAVFVQ